MTTLWIPIILVLFYFLIAGEHTSTLFGCKLQYILDNYQFIKHIVGFIIMFFFVMSTQSKLADVAPTKLLGLVALLYVWVVMSMRMHWIFIIALLMLLFGIYVVNVYKNYALAHGSVESDSLIKRYNIAQRVLGALAVVTTIIGCLIYIGDQKLELGSDWSWTEYFKGSMFCSATETPMEHLWRDKHGNNMIQRATNGAKTLLSLGRNNL